MRRSIVVRPEVASIAPRRILPAWPPLRPVQCPHHELRRLRVFFGPVRWASAGEGAGHAARVRATQRGAAAAGALRPAAAGAGAQGTGLRAGAERVGEVGGTSAPRDGAPAGDPAGPG